MQPLVRPSSFATRSARLLRAKSSSFVLPLLLVTAVAPRLAAQSLTTGAFLPAWGARIGDIDGDGRDDVMTRVSNPLTGDPEYVVLDVATNTLLWHLLRPASASLYPLYDPIGDHDGDGADDLAYWDASSCEIVSGRDGSTIHSLAQPNTYVCGGADFDGDGRADLMVRDGSTAKILSARTGAVLFQRSSGGGTTITGVFPIGDENGDGCEDAALMSIVSGVPYTMTEIVRGPLGSSAGSWNNTKPIGDVTGDGNTDFLCAPDPSVLAVAPFVLAGGSSTNAWFVPGVSPPAFATAPGDIDGDGFAELAVFAGSTMRVLSGATHTPLPGIQPTQLPVPLGDLDGDGRTETLMNGLRCEWTDPALPIASRMVRRGMPGTTSDGRRPYLVTRGHCGLGHTAFFDLRGGLPNGLSVLMFGASVDVDLAPLGAPGNRCYTSLGGGFAFVANSGGVAQFAATMPNTPTLLGASLSLQSVVVDPAANALGLVTSNAIDLTTNN